MDICTAAGAATITDGTGAAATTTACADTTATTRGLSRAPHQKPLSPLHWPGESDVQCRGRSRPTGAAGSLWRSSKELQAWRETSLVRNQPNPISTAIRIRSEWFLAPSFCFSSEVVLATVL